MNVRNDGVRNYRPDVMALLSRRMVTLSTTWTTPSRVVDHDFIVVHKASVNVTREIVDYCVMVSLVEGGLLIPTSNVSPATDRGAES